MRRAGIAVVATALVAVGAAAPSTGGGSRCGAHPWCDPALSPDVRAQMVLAEMTRQEKFDLMAGDDPFGVFTGEPATGFSRGIPRLGIPDLFLNDGPAGLRAVPHGSTGLPAPVSLAASFDAALAEGIGELLGEEGTKRRADVILAPMMNIVRYPGSGRVFETYGEDPYLASLLAAAHVRGIQSKGPIAEPKHYAANNHEINRFTVSAEVDERTLREIYLPAFEASVREAGAGTVMLAYNRVNGTHMTEHGPLVNGVLKDEWGFEGFTVSDWGLAQRSTAGAANNGLEVEMPMRFWYSPEALSLAVDSGRVSMETIDEHVRRILRTYFAFGVFDRDEYPRDGFIDVAAHGAAVRASSAAGTVLLRNEGLLPLGLPPGSTIAVIGPEADDYVRGGGSSAVDPFYTVTPLDGITDRAARDGIEVVHDDGSNRLSAIAAAAGADAAIVFGSDAATEFADRPCLSFNCTGPQRIDRDGLIRDVAAANPNTIVLLETSGPVLMPWVDDVAAIVEAWYPGQEGGNAIADVLWGDAEPGGRLPVTFPARDEDTPFFGHPERWPGVAEQAHYSEGVFVGYRWYDEHGIEPLFEFGHGLSYTTFAYENFQVHSAADTIKAGVNVRNTGARAGSEVVQLYVGKPEGPVEQPPKWLAGAAKLSVAPGEAERATFTLDARALSYWDTSSGAWVVEPGCYEIMAGSSSRDIQASAKVPAGGGVCPA